MAGTSAAALTRASLVSRLAASRAPTFERYSASPPVFERKSDGPPWALIGIGVALAAAAYVVYRKRFAQ